MIGQRYQALVQTDDVDGIAPIWTTKAGGERTLRLGAYVDGVLTAVTTPTLVVRRPEAGAAEAQTYQLEAYVDPSGELNLERIWTAAEITALGAGRFIAEVRGTVGGAEVVFPDAGYIELRIQPGVSV